MTNFTEDGGVLPSWMGVEDEGDFEGPRSAYYYARNNMSLKIGQIDRIYPPDDTKNNVRQNTYEYDVIVTERIADGASTQVTFRRCQVKDLFGGISDFFEYTLRESKKEKDKRDPEFKNGSLVLVLCLNGIAEDAMIIGGVKHPSRKNNAKKEDGHNLKFEFNGINFNIDKDGAMTLLFKGPTDADGNILEGSEEFGGTTIRVEKDGSYEVNTGQEKNPTQFRLDKTKKTTLLTSEKEQSFLTMDKYTVKADKDISFTSGAALSIMATGAATFEAKSLEAKLKASFKLKCKEMKVESGTTTEFKTKQFKTSDLTILAGGGTPLALSTLTTIGTGNMSAPVVSSMISGFATKVLGK